MFRTSSFIYTIILAVFLSSAALNGEQPKENIDLLPIYDVVIVGGGVSGTYSAWRLSEKAKMDESEKKAFG